MLFEKKTRFRRSENTPVEEFYERAGIWAEFGKVICISVGYLHRSGKGSEFRIRSFYGHDERKLLLDFRELLKRYFNSSKHALCAHNGKEFDFPYLARRMLINGIELPIILQIQGKKPWEVNHIDTMELWKFGDFKHYCSLPLLCHVFKIPSPKGDIDGSEVASVYYEKKDLERIVRYCEADTIALTRLYLRMLGHQGFKDEAIKRYSSKIIE